MHSIPASDHPIKAPPETRLRLTARFSLLAVLVFCLAPVLPSWGLTSVKLGWNLNPEADVVGYWISLGPSSRNYTTVKTVGNVPTFTLIDLDHSTTYFCAIQAYASTGLLSDYSAEISFTTEAAVPEIKVSGPNGSPMTDGSALVSFGSVGVGSSDVTRTIIIENEGSADLTGISVLLGGLLPSDYSVSAPASSTLAPGQGIPITITCRPGNVGDRSAVLRISSNDADESPFEIQLAGIGVITTELMASWALASGLTGANAASSAIPFRDGVSNLLKYAFNMNAAAADVRVLKKSTGSSGLPAFALESGAGSTYFTVEYLRRRGSGLVYTPKTSTTLSDFTPMAGTPVVTAINDGWERVIVKTPVDPAITPRMFGRVDVVNPASGVTPEIVKFEQWAVESGLSGDQAEVMATPHDEGVPNLLKYAFNLNAAGPDPRVLAGETGTAGLPLFAVDRSGAQSYFTVEFIRRKNSGLVYTPKVSADLKAFTLMTGDTSFTSIDDIWERVRVRKAIDPAASPRLFGIVELTMP